MLDSRSDEKSVKRCNGSVVRREPEVTCLEGFMKYTCSSKSGVCVSFYDI